jgi:hypothetical protein
MLQLRKESQANLVSTSGGHRENWGESTMAEASPMTDTSTDDTDDKNQRVMSLALVINLILLFRDQIIYKFLSVMLLCDNLVLKVICPFINIV